MRHGLILTLFGLCCCMGAAAQNPPKTTGSQKSEATLLTPKQVQAGWILLFDGTTDYGWKSRTDTKWSVTEGKLTCDATNESLLSTTAEFGDIELHYECTKHGAGRAGVFLGAPPDGPMETNKLAFLPAADTKNKQGKQAGQPLSSRT